MKNMREELKKAFEEGTFYDFIANNYYEFTKDELKEIILNLDWVATGTMNYDGIKKFYKDVKEELENRDFWAD